MTDWKIVRGSSEPLEIDTTSSKKYVYLRRNISEVEVSIGEGEDATTYTEYEYEEKKMTKDEYKAYFNNMPSYEELSAKLDYLAMMCDVDLMEV